jgi:hypothetical protein
MRSIPFAVIWQTATGEQMREFDNASETLAFYRQHHNDADKLDMVIETNQGRRLSENDLARLAGQGFT